MNTQPTFQQPPLPIYAGCTVKAPAGSCFFDTTGTQFTLETEGRIYHAKHGIYKLPEGCDFFTVVNITSLPSVPRPARHGTPVADKYQKGSPCIRFMSSRELKDVYCHGIDTAKTLEPLKDGA
ncbi:hypothetical protein [Parendozoicomonas haliclonae]|uniref:Uncharacterized protein n=1 Tax=Parendozoicomonas haliclonae TaxID=1960125 RepID=A0A1X7AKF7_9GAMM|nr:hypothetical protein [Parendozoicomonas haliclonae]SMA47358.1 hypothetical protein EHSB41UT_02383 [Parendozoicomonas haliclonae]